MEALKGVSLTIQDGEFVAIMGQNGAGKTTLVKHFNGLLKPTKGKVLVSGIETTKMSVATLAKNVGFVFQNPDHQLFSETVEDEIAFALKNFGFKENIIKNPDKPEESIKTKLKQAMKEFLDESEARDKFIAKVLQ